jgi:EcoRII C terminal.
VKIGVSNDYSKIANLINNSPWNNTYWFARMLLNGDKYGAVAKKDNLLIDLVNKLETIIQQKSLSEDEQFRVCMDILNKAIKSASREGSKTVALTDALAEDLDNEINSLEDITIFILAVKYIILEINKAMQFVPSNDREFCYETAKNILDTLGEVGISKLLSIWDNLGVRGCLDVERSVVVSEFTKLRSTLSSLDIKRSLMEDNMLLTAFVQEFERRLGQKRKSRAGNSLEDVATFLFDYYGFNSHPKPDHFQTDIEVDKWFKCKDGWTIGISCKRTLRERWKQVSSADGNTLSRYKIKEIWHLTTYDKDLSDDKLTMLGQQRQIFYLSEESEKYQIASTHIGMKDYVRPLTQLIADIRREQGK